MLDLSRLNPPQREAVLHGDGPLVVFAGAGSGKTRVITYRIAHMVLERGVDPASILAVTFTNKAAAEMRERLYPLLGPAARRLVVGTFHSTAARLLREYAAGIGLSKDFVIYDDGDQAAMLKRILRDQDVDDREVPAKLVAQRIDAAKNRMMAPEDLTGFDHVTTIVRTAYATYEARMRAANALDFGDLIVVFARALEQQPAFREALTARFRSVLVDEFQDTNHAQLRLVNALVAGHRNLCVVGDDDQSIYRWRGAERRNILEFRQRYHDARVVKLEQNYRSSANILRAAYEVIRRAAEREDKHLFTQNDEGEPVLVVRTADERDEAEMVVRGVRQLVGDGVPLSEVAVFYRTHAQSRVIEEHLRAHAVPYRIVGGQRFFERAEIKDALAYLRLVANPADDVSCLRIVNTPPRGIGKTTIDRIAEEASRRGLPVLATMTELTRGGALPKAAAGKVDAFVELVAGLRTEHLTGTELSILAGYVLERSGYERALTADDSAESDARLENLREFVTAMHDYESNEPGATLSGFLERVSLDVGEEAAGEVERLTLMTVHAAKGLEFDVVMVTGLEEDVFPSKSLSRFEPEEMDEERRLAYVAFTRARTRLILSHADVRRVYGQEKRGGISRFLREIAAASQQVDARPAHLRRASSSLSSGYGGGYSGGYGGGYGGRTGAAVGRAAPGRAGGGYDDTDLGHGHDADDFTPDLADVPPARTSARGSAGSYVDASEGDCGLDTLRPGTFVHHRKFGDGVVRSVSPGAPPKCVVRFAIHGDKTVVATFLELRR